jgi:hypothetical protein
LHDGDDGHSTDDEREKLEEAQTVSVEDVRARLAQVLAESVLDVRPIIHRGRQALLARWIFC